MVRKGGQVIRARYIEDGGDDDALAASAVDEEAHWLAYEAGPAAPPPPKPVQRPSRPKKRRLKPRMPVTETA